MSEFQDRHSEDHNAQDDASFDRLVDGQMTEGEYRAFLTNLDDEPGGWRRCALAFLEAQALERELESFRDEKVAPPSSDVSQPTSATHTNRKFNMPLLVLAMAASFLLAFGLGYALKAPWQNGLPSGGDVAEQSNPSGQNPGGQDQDIAPSSSESRFAGNQRDYPRTPDLAQRPLQNVTLVVGGDAANAERIELPVVHYGDVGDGYFRLEHSAVPPEFREMLERHGQLRRTQSYLPLEMDNGQRVVVPVEEVCIVPVSRPPY